MIPRALYLFYFDLISGERNTLPCALLRLLLLMLSFFYMLAVRVRRLLFRIGFLRAYRATCPVISVGNIVAGGTGKTPLVEWISKFLQSEGHKPAILSRGYKGQGTTADEARMLRSNLPEVQVLVGADRVASAKYAVEKLGVDVLVLDDGFSHFRLERDLDIVALDAIVPLGYGKLLPRGLMREPAESIERADVVVLARSNLVSPERLTSLEQGLRFLFPEKPVLSASVKPLEVMDLSTGSALSPRFLSGKRSLAFCGIASPEAFRRTLAGLDVEIVGFEVYPDHYAYDVADELELLKLAQERGAELLLTTQKDASRFDFTRDFPLPIYALRVGISFDGDSGLLEERLRRVVSASRAGT